jgi:hypothetical protein
MASKLLALVYSKSQLKVDAVRAALDPAKWEVRSLATSPSGAARPSQPIATSDAQAFSMARERLREAGAADAAAASLHVVIENVVLETPDGAVVDYVYVVVTDAAGSGARTEVRAKHGVPVPAVAATEFYAKRPSYETFGKALMAVLTRAGDSAPARVTHDDWNAYVGAPPRAAIVAATAAAALHEHGAAVRRHMATALCIAESL